MTRYVFIVRDSHSIFLAGLPAHGQNLGAVTTLQYFSDEGPKGRVKTRENSTAISTIGESEAGRYCDVEFGPSIVMEELMSVSAPPPSTNNEVGSDNIIPREIASFIAHRRYLYVGFILLIVASAAVALIKFDASIWLTAIGLAMTGAYVIFTLFLVILTYNLFKMASSAVQRSEESVRQGERIHRISQIPIIEAVGWRSQDGIFRVHLVNSGNGPAFNVRLALYSQILGMKGLTTTRTLGESIRYEYRLPTALRANSSFPEPTTEFGLGSVQRTMDMCLADLIPDLADASIGVEHDGLFGSCQYA